jgi:hypothetical protein
MLIVAYMVGMANSIKQEERFMDDTFYQIEVKDEQSDDEPFDSDDIIQDQLGEKEN